MLEKNIENKVCKYAKSLGWVNYKFSSPSHRSVPDRFFLKNGKIIFIEFKATGKKPSIAQEIEIRDLKALGFKVFVIDSVNKGKDLFNKL